MANELISPHRAGGRSVGQQQTVVLRTTTPRIFVALHWQPLPSTRRALVLRKSSHNQEIVYFGSIQLGQARLVRHDFILWQSYKRQTDERTNEQPFLFIIINFIFRVFAFLVIALKDGRTGEQRRRCSNSNCCFLFSLWVVQVAMSPL